jgi:hypothetical protein
MFEATITPTLPQQKFQIAAPVERIKWWQGINFDSRMLDVTLYALTYSDIPR